MRVPSSRAAISACWEKLDRPSLGDVSKLIPAALEYDNGIAYGFSSVGLYYNTEMFAQNGWDGSRVVAGHAAPGVQPEDHHAQRE